MHPMRMPFTITGKIISGITICALMFSLTACIPEQNGEQDPANFHGLLINSDVNSNLLGGIRLPSGEAVSVYGTFNSDGSIGEIEEVVYEDAEGASTSLQFASGRPVLALLPDGSRVDIRYDEVSEVRLKGTVTVFSAATGETYESEFDVDLQMAMADLSNMIEDLTGGAINISEHAGAGDPTARLLGPVPTNGKQVEVRQQLVGQLLFVAVLAGAGFLMVCTMANVMNAVLTVTQMAMRPVVIAIFAPLIIMGEICRLAATHPRLTINVEVRPIYLPASLRG